MNSPETVLNADTRAATLRKARLCCRLAIGQLIALCLLFVVWHFVVWPPKANPWIILGFQILPLLAFLPGMLRDKPRVYVWLCFFILLYFCQGILNLFLLPLSLGIMGAFETLLTVGLFNAAMFAARYLAQAENQPAVQP